MNAHGPRAHALLVEDDPVSRAFLGEALTALGWNVAAFGDAASALERARQDAFALLVADRNLPGVTGEALLAAIRSDAASPSRHARALALTADPDPHRHAALCAAGFDAVAAKPIALEVLAKLLESLGFATGEPASAGIAAETDVHAGVPVWDDAAGLRAVGGNEKSLAALRRMLQRDLPAQRARIESAAPDDPAAACAELHRLRAACGFTGAARLAQAVHDLDMALRQEGDAGNALAAFATAADATGTAT